jgi:hypothetical protein
VSGAAWAYVAVDKHDDLAQIGEAHLLDFARRLYAGADHLGPLAALQSSELFEGHAAHVHVDVNAVYDGAEGSGACGVTAALDHAGHAGAPLGCCVLT